MLASQRARMVEGSRQKWLGTTHTAAVRSGAGGPRPAGQGRLEKLELGVGRVDQDEVEWAVAAARSARLREHVGAGDAAGGLEVSLPSGSHR